MVQHCWRPMSIWKTNVERVERGVREGDGDGGTQGSIPSLSLERGVRASGSDGTQRA